MLRICIKEASNHKQRFRALLFKFIQRGVNEVKLIKSNETLVS